MKQALTRGFTLIEILVIVSVLGILFSIISLSGVGVGDDARIAKEEATVKQLNVAFELYRSVNDSFPPGTDNCSWCNLEQEPPDYAAAATQWSAVVTALSPEYINEEISVDTWGNTYAYDNNYREANTSLYTSLCSMGPDGILQSVLLDMDIASGIPQAAGDDICIFML